MARPLYHIKRCEKAPLTVRREQSKITELVLFTKIVTFLCQSLTKITENRYIFIKMFHKKILLA